MWLTLLNRQNCGTCWRMAVYLPSNHKEPFWWETLSIVTGSHPILFITAKCFNCFQPVITSSESVNRIDDFCSSNKKKRTISNLSSTGTRGLLLLKMQGLTSVYPFNYSTSKTRDLFTLHTVLQELFQKSFILISH